MMPYSPTEMLDYISSVILSLPGGRTGLCYGTPGFYAQQKLIGRIREDGETLVLYHQDRDALLNLDPAIYFVTEHYYNHPYVLVNLCFISREALKKNLIVTWHMRAAPKMLKAYAAQQP
jgi:hypothetical protein